MSRLLDAGLLQLLMLFIVWGATGLLMTSALFSISKREQAVVGLGLAIVVNTFLTNLLAQWMPVHTAIWVSAAFWLVFSAAVFAWQRLNLWSLILRQNISAVLVLLLAALVFVGIERGLGIFDDYQNLPTISLMATGDVPPHFPLDGSQRFGYHYFLFMLSAMLMLVGDFFPWSALDLARGLTLAITLVLSYFVAFRVTRNKAVSFMSSVFVAFSGGIRWVLLLLPTRWLNAFSEHIDLIGSGIFAGKSFAETLTAAWPLDGGPALSLPFAFTSGVNQPLVMVHGGVGTMALLLISLLLLLAKREKNVLAKGITVILLASLALTEEVKFILLGLGFVLVWAIAALRERKQFRLSPEIRQWIIIWAAAGVISLLQGGMLTEVPREMLQKVMGAAESSYYTMAFQFVFPPVIVSGHYGILALNNFHQALVAFLEIGPYLLLLPLLIAWGMKMTRQRRWMHASLFGMVIASIALTMVLYVADGLVTSGTRFYGGLVTIGKLYAVPLAWLWARKKSQSLQTGLLSLGLISIVGGMVLFGIQLTVIPHPVNATFISDMDRTMTARHWDQLEQDAIMFDPIPERAATVFGRYTNSSYSWFRHKPEWERLVEMPNLQDLHAAGYSYVYIDRAYHIQHWAIFEDACVQVIDQVDGEKFQYIDFVPDYRILLQISACK